MSGSPLVSVVALNYNGKDDLQILFDSVSRTRYPNMEVIMVDNGSTDGSIDFVKEHFPFVRIIGNGENLGAASGFNIGIQNSKGKYVSLLSDGMEVDPDWLQPLVDVMETQEDVASLDAWLLDYHDRKRFDVVSGAGRYADYFGNILVRGAGELHSGYDRRIRRVFAGVALIRKEVFDEVGLFDPDFFFGYEDIDLFYRVNLAGYRVLSVPSSKIYHKSGDSSKRGKRRRPGFYYLEKRNRLVSMVKNLPLGLLILAIPVILLEYSSYLAFWTLKRNRRNLSELVTALSWFFHLKNVKSLWVKRKQARSNHKGKGVSLGDFLLPYCGDPLRLLEKKTPIGRFLRGESR